MHTNNSLFFLNSIYYIVCFEYAAPIVPTETDLFASSNKQTTLNSNFYLNVFYFVSKVGDVICPSRKILKFCRRHKSGQKTNSLQSEI